MQLTIAKKELLKILARMQGVAERKSTMPVLANVLLETDGQGLRIAATDLYLCLVGSVSAEVDKPGSVAVSAKDLFERIKMMPDGPVSLSVDAKHQTTLKAKGSARRYTLRGQPGEEYPPLPKPDPGSPRLSIECTVMSGLIDHARFAISTDETRAHMNSGLFEWEGNVVRMVATDGHRLAKVEHDVSGSASSTMLIPLKAISELQKLLADAQSEWTGDKDAPLMLGIVQSGSSAFFEIGGLTFSVKLIDAQFPPYSQVIPKSSERTFRLPRAALADVIKAISVAANERTGAVKLSFAKGTLSVTSGSPEGGDGVDEVAYSVESGKDGALVGLNAKYPLDAFGSIPYADEVLFGVSGELDPLVIKTAVEAAFRSINVVMPMRI